METAVERPVALRRPVPLVKQPSEGTLKLNNLRKQLEMLEAKKAHMLLQEEAERKRLKEIVNERYNALRQTIDGSLQELHEGLNKLNKDEQAITPSTPSP